LLRVGNIGETLERERALKVVVETHTGPNDRTQRMLVEIVENMNWDPTDNTMDFLQWGLHHENRSALIGRV
jgi:hypothetical protein